MRLQFYLIGLMCCFLGAKGYAQELTDTVWGGGIKYQGIDFIFNLRFENSGDSLTGWISIPQQKVKDRPLINVRYNDPNVSFVMPSRIGNASFEGKLINDSITGVFKQNALITDCQFTPGEKKLEKRDYFSMLGPPPYLEEEVSFKSGDIELKGTLTKPKSDRQFPVVVLISGSGPQDRNSEIFGFEMFRILADHLSRNGLAVLRFDERGVGDSGGEFEMATSMDFAADVKAAVKYLRSRKDINPQKVGLYGHSEGGIVAPLVASKDTGIAFIVLAAPPAIPGDSLLLLQNEQIMIADSVDPERARQKLELRKKIFSCLKTDKKCDFRSELREEISNDLKLSGLDTVMTSSEFTAYTDSLIKQSHEQFESKWFRFFMQFDPAPVLEKVNCPVLILFGKLDRQVPEDPNRVALENALRKGGNAQFKSISFNGTNHLFQTARTGSPTEYPYLPKVYTSGYLTMITNWLIEQAYY